MSRAIGGFHLFESLELRHRGGEAEVVHERLLPGHDNDGVAGINAVCSERNDELCMQEHETALVKVIRNGEQLPSQMARWRESKSEDWLGFIPQT